MNQKINGDKIYIGPAGFYVNGLKITDQNVIDEYGKRMFWAKVSIKEDDNLCWEWMGSTNTRGYGHTEFNGVATAASRKAYMLHNNIILQDRKMLVCHSCDNPVCCNPKHLFLGTSKDNVRDMVKKGRGKGQYVAGAIKKYEEIRRGSKNHMAKISEKDVIKIRKLWRKKEMSLKEIAILFNMASATISQIANYKRWKHVI